MNKTRSSWLPHPFLSLSLWLIWLLLNNTVSAGHMLLGAILALVIPLLTRGFWPETLCLSKPKTLFKFILVVLWDILVANLIVARLILGKRDHLQPSFLAVPLELDSPLAIGILANTISLTPGTVSCDLSADRKTLLVHALDAKEPQEIIDEIKERYERPLKEVFESCSK
ncbi:Na+/H+ antiporter subunit E [Thiomicrorhabdus sp. 6S3-12]|uniref:Na+/H+ antiporter subunit E n=1 Tax=Thiomicrorhabdus sp. 6S3-12 TaxID=2819681 RepID=UPI001AAD447C|nr:Na+/H+ antiporter subunit E [Thiomicrorhabdus sp. 6S3-12]MBO1924892.1 Na+/H+ antiporter subunit E [Thiomicrorhabdus sp. 6S3-12]